MSITINPSSSFCFSSLNIDVLNKTTWSSSLLKFFILLIFLNFLLFSINPNFWNINGIIPKDKKFWKKLMKVIKIKLNSMFWLILGRKYLIRINMPFKKYDKDRFNN